MRFALGIRIVPFGALLYFPTGQTSQTDLSEPIWYPAPHCAQDAPSGPYSYGAHGLHSARSGVHRFVEVQRSGVHAVAALLQLPRLATIGGSVQSASRPLNGAQEVTWMTPSSTVAMQQVPWARQSLLDVNDGSLQLSHEFGIVPTPHWLQRPLRPANPCGQGRQPVRSAFGSKPSGQRTHSPE